MAEQKSKVEREDFAESGNVTPLRPETREETAGEPAEPNEPAGRAGVRGIAREFVRDLFSLMNREFDLAKSEIGDKVEEAGTGIKSMIAGGAVLFFGGQVIVAALVLLLATAMEPWIAALIVGFVISGVGIALIGGGRKNVSSDHFIPEDTIRSLREDGHAAREVIEHAKGQYGRYKNQ